MALEFVSGLKKKLKKERERKAVREYRKEGKSLAAKHLMSAPASSRNWAKVAAKRVNEETARRKKKKEDELAVRKIQLAKMPKGRGMAELNRLNESGNVKQTKAEKEAEARKKQLAGMPKGRGKTPPKEEVRKAAAKQEAEKRTASKYSSGATGKKAKKKEEKSKPENKVKKLLKGLA